jgi:hypothetical protein
LQVCAVRQIEAQKGRVAAVQEMRLSSRTKGGQSCAAKREIKAQIEKRNCYDPHVARPILNFLYIIFFPKINTPKQIYQIYRM